MTRSERAVEMARDRPCPNKKPSAKAGKLPIGKRSSSGAAKIPAPRTHIEEARESKSKSAKAAPAEDPPPASTFSSSPSPSARLREARALRTEATTATDLAEVEKRLRTVLSDLGPPEQIKDEKCQEAWVNAGIFLATLLLQGDAHGRAAEISQLLSDRGFGYRLSVPALTHRHDGASDPPPLKYASAWDDVLPAELVQRLDAAFRPESEFWPRHDYSDGSGGRDPSPYFSYVAPLAPSDSDGDSEEETTALMAIIRRIQKQVSKTFPAVAECRHAEWWAHCRPHSSGHQLHFDSDDEGRGGVRNPVASTVLNLSHSSQVGGETLVTSQTSSARSLAVNRGWLCANARNRLLAFKGDLLHGVLPGHGVPKHEGGDDARSQERRVTFMVAFWKDLAVQDKEGHGSSRPFSRVKDEPWARPLTERINSEATKTGDAARPAENCFYEVPVWEDVDETRNKEIGMSLRDVRKYKLLPQYDEFFQFFS